MTDRIEGPSMLPAGFRLGGIEAIGTFEAAREALCGMIGACSGRIDDLSRRKPKPPALARLEARRSELTRQLIGLHPDDTEAVAGIIRDAKQEIQRIRETK